MLTSILLSAGLLMSGLPSGFYEPALDSLHAVTITADKGVTISRSDTLRVINSASASDILLQSPGFYVGDNGGLSGLKTVSLRGMGSAHTSIYMDGVRVGNVQSGQSDLSMLPFENIGSAIVDYAQNSISFKTARPVFGSRSVAGMLRLHAGSFGTWMPSARMDFRLSEKASLSAHVSGVRSKGDYGYGEGLARENNDLEQIRAGLDFFGLAERGDYHIKAYYNASDRGTPGSVDWPSDDRQTDRNAFVQAVLRKKFSKLYTLHLSGKTSYDDIFYSSSWGDSRYEQTEMQLNSAHDFQIRDWWKISAAADIQWDALSSTNYNAFRQTVFSAMASSFRTGRFSADISLEYNGAYDRDALSRHAFSPSVNLRLRLAEGLDLMAFGRRAYRIPTFNELYYVGYGNPELKPEDAWLTDIGLDFFRTFSADWAFKARIDGFNNYLTDKIISAPSAQDPNIWLPYNIGKVHSYGFDASAGISHQGDWHYSIDAKYSCSCGRQIPYVARHALAVIADVEWKGWNLNSVWQMRAGRTDATGSLPDWNTLDVNLVKSFQIMKAGCMSLRLSLRNLFDCRYETARGYPMPGRNFITGVEFKF
jgi:outer membrane cobalamin receptor